MKFKSKKGLTLVELIVTVAILSITASMGIGIFASVLRNYSTASVLAEEQKKANQLESILTDYARKCDNYYFISNAYAYDDKNDHKITDSSVLEDEVLDSQFIVMGANSSLANCSLYIYEDPTDIDADPELTPEYYCEGVEYIKLTVSTYYLGTSGLDFTDNLLESSILDCLNYEIKMQGGYTLKGSVVMPNSRRIHQKDETEISSSVTSAPFEMGVNSPYTRGIAFVATDTDV